MREIVLNIHGIGDPDRAPRSLEPGEATYWISASLWREAVDRAAAALAAGRAQVRFTFDDGNISDIEIGAPALEAAGLSGLFFPLAGRIGEPGSLSAADLADLVRRGHGVGNHGHGHVDWRHANLELELKEAREIIATVSGAPVVEAAIPFGLYNRVVLKALRAAGYAACYSSDGGPVRPGDWPLPRVSLTGGMTPTVIDDLIIGRESLPRRLRRPLARLRKRLL